MTKDTKHVCGTKILILSVLELVPEHEKFCQVEMISKNLSQRIFNILDKKEFAFNPTLGGKGDGRGGGVISLPPTVGFPLISPKG